MIAVILQRRQGLQAGRCCWQLPTTPRRLHVDGDGNGASQRLAPCATCCVAILEEIALSGSTLLIAALRPRVSHPRAERCCAADGPVPPPHAHRRLLSTAPPPSEVWAAFASCRIETNHVIQHYMTRTITLPSHQSRRFATSGGTASLDGHTRRLPFRGSPARTSRLCAS